MAEADFSRTVTGNESLLLGTAELSQMSCYDFSEFKESLKTLRLIDDKIIYKLNTSVPTDSFKHEVDAEGRCRELYSQLKKVYQTRDDAIKGCIAEVSERVKNLREQKNKDPDNFDIMKKLRKEQTCLRLMQTELSVEEVVKQRSFKVFAERCWKAYKPDDL
ncbi:protein MIX23-like [Rhopilema esculentum]|uniref:protein MIX23-like n=1 Tax=Rhopilema esculentum TaxID=499914 RepID=UPI0031E28B21